MEDGYNPDGWLGPLCRNNLFYDFGKPDIFNVQFRKLKSRLLKIQDLGHDKGLCCYNNYLS